MARCPDCPTFKPECTLCHDMVESLLVPYRKSDPNYNVGFPNTKPFSSKKKRRNDTYVSDPWNSRGYLE
jgi:hypothetical protein